MTKSHSPPTRNSNDFVVVVNPSGPHHRDRCRTSVNASNTTSRGALMTREITISRSAVADCAGAPRPVALIKLILLPCLLEVLHVLVQPVEALVPEPLEPAGPLVNRSQPAGVKAVQALLACLAVPHQSDLPEHPQVFGRPRLGHPQLLGQLGHRPLTRPQQYQDLPALRLGDRVEDVRRRRSSCHGAIICLYRNVCQCPVARPRASSRSERRYLKPTGLSPTSWPA